MTQNIKSVIFLFTLLLAIMAPVSTAAAMVQEQAQDTTQFREFKGTVVDAQYEDPLVFATITLEGTNVSTVTNPEGDFSLKVPLSMTEAYLNISFLGYESKRINISKLTRNGNVIKLTAVTISLEEVSVSGPKDAGSLVKSMLQKRGDNSLSDPVQMTAFYREIIKKRRKDASLAEAVVYIYKQPNQGSRNDIVTLYKSRKSTNYNRLDTVAVKLQGGPFTPLYLDITKYPENIFTDEMFDNYEFRFEESTQVNDMPVYVVAFNQLSGIEEPLYYGKLYIQMSNHALVSAVFNLNVENRERVSELLVRKKPAGTQVYPTEAAYRVDYRVKNGKWYYGYSNVQLAVVVNKRGKLFNSKYYLSSEMAVTDWKVYTSNERIKGKDRMRPSVIISDEASGFSDPDFWGPYNVIEPEKSIESAIEKIQRQLEKEAGSK